MIEPCHCQEIMVLLFMNSRELEKGSLQAYHSYYQEDGQKIKCYDSQGTFKQQVVNIIIQQLVTFQKVKARHVQKQQKTFQNQNVQFLFGRLESGEIRLAYFVNKFIIYLVIFEQRHNIISIFYKNKFQMVCKKRWREKNVEIQARVVIQESSTPELPGERGKCLLKF